MEKGIQRRLPSNESDAAEEGRDPDREHNNGNDEKFHLFRRRRIEFGNARQILERIEKDGNDA